MKFVITNQKTGQKETLIRDVRIAHPKWVHKQCGTNNEEDLQDMLNQYRIDSYYNSKGEYLGPDSSGIEMWI